MESNVQVPGAGRQPPLSPERVHSGAANSTITRLGPFEFYNFDYFVFVIDHGRRFVDFVNDHPVTRDLSWWICSHGDHKMPICRRCYHPFDFIYVELKRHRLYCP